MAVAIVSDLKPHKWFSPQNFNFKLSLPRRLSYRSKTLTPSLSSPSPKQEEYGQVFRHFDSNGDGKISSAELRAYFASIGEPMSSAQAQSVVAEFDNDGDGFLDFPDFIKLMERDGGEADDDLKRAFEMFESDKGSGCITPKGLQRMLNRLGDRKSYQDCVSMIRVFDLDGNGVLDFHEFHSMMTPNS